MNRASSRRDLWDFRMWLDFVDVNLNKTLLLITVGHVSRKHENLTGRKRAERA